jgi:hypothetical protein
MIIAFCVERESLGREHSCHERTFTGFARVLSKLQFAECGMPVARSSIIEKSRRAGQGRAG